MGIIGVFNRNKEMITENKTPTELCMECEKIIEDEKKEYGYVSKMTMRFLREKYGTDRADRAMYRQQKKNPKKIKSNEPSLIDELSKILYDLVKDKKETV